MWKNIIGVFKKDNLYQQAFDEACEMMETNGKMYAASVESLRQSDTAEIKIDIYALDKEINKAERDVRKKVMKHLILSGDAQLTSGLALVSVVIDIERIGDYTKNIFDLARQVMDDYKEEISADSEKMTDDIISGAVSDLKSPEAAAVVLYARFLKRIGSHSRNIATSIVNPFHRIGYNEKTDKNPGTDIIPPSE